MNEKEMIDVAMKVYKKSIIENIKGMNEKECQNFFKKFMEKNNISNIVVDPNQPISEPVKITKDDKNIL